MTDRKPVPIHNLRHNAREWSPHRVLVFDTETVPVGEPGHEDQVLRLWRAELVLRHGRQRTGPEISTYGGTSVDGLVQLIEHESSRGDALWVYSHNLNFDLAVTALPMWLCEQGWKLTQHALASEAPWCRLAKGDAHVTISDSASLFPAPVAELGRAVGVAKPPLPDAAAPDAVWAARCEADVAAVRAAIIQLMDWWDESASGNWSLTGPSCGWNRMRHRHLQSPVLIDPDEQARAMERRAISGGRREAMRWGQLPPGLFADLDFHSAHATVMANMPLPCKRLGSFSHLEPTNPALRGQGLDVMAECTVHTYTPRYPMDTGSGIFYPVGRFKTVLCGPEIREAMARNELVTVGAGFAYQLSYHGRDWAQWVLGALDSDPPVLPPAVAIAAKAWSRFVPGRWASRTGEVVDTRPDPRAGWYYEDGIHYPTGRRCGLLTIGGTQHVIVQDLDGDDSFPAVLGWIQSWTRLMLGRLIDSLGDAVVQCNTDGCIVDVMTLHRSLAGSSWQEYGHRGDPQRFLREVLASVRDELHPFEVRVKKLAERVNVIGAQHVVLDGELRFSGIPRSATELGDDRYQFEAWPKLYTQMQQGPTGSYRVQTRTADLSKVPINRWRMRDGWADAVHADVDPEGRNVIMPPPHGYGIERQVLGPDWQHPALRGVMECIAH